MTAYISYWSNLSQTVFPWFQWYNPWPPAVFDGSERLAAVCEVFGDHRSAEDTPGCTI